jgi:hypothetical protein
MNIQVVNKKQTQSQSPVDTHTGNSELFSLGKRSVESLNTQESIPELVAKKQVKRQKSKARETPNKSIVKTDPESTCSLFQHTEKDFKIDITALSTCPEKHDTANIIRNLNKSINAKLGLSLIVFEESLQRLKIAAQKALSEEDNHSEDSLNPNQKPRKHRHRAPKRQIGLIDQLQPRELNLAQFLNPQNDPAIFTSNLRLGTAFTKVTTPKRTRRCKPKKEQTSLLTHDDATPRTPISDSQIDILLQKNSQNLAVDFSAIKTQYDLPNFCHKDSKNFLVQSFNNLSKKNVFVGTGRQQSRIEVMLKTSKPARLSPRGYDKYFCKHLDDNSCCSKNLDNSSQSSGKLPECSSILSSGCGGLLEKGSDQGSKIMWENADWLYRPRNYGTDIDLMCNDLIEEREIFDGPLSIHNSNSVCGKYFG